MKIPEYLSEGKYPLHYWKEREDNFPILAKLSKINLSAPATVEPVERLFSIVGYIFRPDRCRLD